MSGAAIVRYLMVDSANLTAVVPAARILSGAVPQGYAMPSISVMQIASFERRTVTMAETGRHTTERVSVSIVAREYPELRRIADLIRKALPLSKTSVDGFECDSVLPESEGPDIATIDPPAYIQSLDYVVRYKRSI